MLLKLVLDSINSTCILLQNTRQLANNKPHAISLLIPLIAIISIATFMKNRFIMNCYNPLTKPFA